MGNSGKDAHGIRQEIVPIGGGALNGLAQAGIRVFAAAAPTVGENVALARRGALSAWESGRTCGGHGHGSGCAHHGA